MTTIKKKKRRGGQKEEATSQKFSDIGNVVPGVDIYGIRTTLRYSGIMLLAITAAVRGSIKLRTGFALASIFSLLTPPLLY